jgi:hypothetical protein
VTKAIAIASLAFLVACTTTAPLDSKQIWCQFNSPRAPLSNADTAPRPIVDEHNDYQDKGIAWCGWRIGK